MMEEMIGGIRAEIEEKIGIETRTVVPGHILRGGSPVAYDRFLSTQLGAHAAKLIKEGKFGYTVAVKGGLIAENPLKDIAGKTKYKSSGSQFSRFVVPSDTSAQLSLVPPKTKTVSI